MTQKNMISLMMKLRLSLKNRIKNNIFAMGAVNNIDIKPANLLHAVYAVKFITINP